MTTLIDLMDNIALLTLIGLGFYFVESGREERKPVATNALHGVNFGVAAFLVTASPLTMTDGATIDARAGPVILAGFIGGPVGGLIAASLGALSRQIVGGGFVFSGVIVYFLYAALGLAISRLRTVAVDSVFKPKSIIVLTILSWIGASAMFLLIEPMDRAIAWLQEDLPLILLANSFSVVFSAAVVGAAMHFLRKAREAALLSERLNPDYSPTLA